MCISNRFCEAMLATMKRTSSVLLIVLGAVSALSPLLIWGENEPPQHSHFAGVYLSHNVGTSMNLSLGKDGSATVTEAPNGADAQTLFGHWTDLGGQVKVEFNAVEGTPAEPPMIFQAGHD